MNNNPPVPDDIKQEFQDLAAWVCDDAKLDDEEWPSERDRLVRRWEHYYRQGAAEGLSPLEAKARTIKAWGGLSRLTESLRDPWYVRLLSYKRCRPMRYFLIVLGILSVSILVLPTVLAFMLTGLVAYVTAEVFKSDREMGWVRLLVDVGCRVVLVILSLFGGLCLFVEKHGFWGPWEKAQALYQRAIRLLPRDSIGKVAVPIILVLLLGRMSIKYSGFQYAEYTERMARTARSVETDASSSAINSITGQKASEASGSVTSFAKEKSGAVELDGSKPAGSFADALPSDGLVASGLEPSVRKANEEPPPSVDQGVNAGATVSIAESKVNEASGGGAPLANARSEAIEPDGSKLPVAAASSPTLNDLVVSKLQLAVQQTDERPAPPTNLRVVAVGVERTSLSRFISPSVVKAAEGLTPPPASADPDLAKVELAPPPAPTGLRIVDVN